VLREAGVVDTEPCGRFIYYKLKPEVIEALANSFAELATIAGQTVETGRKRAC
jgi:ArsR family transcriptional regulator